MLHACFVSISTCFLCTSIHFFSISGTNLFTRCHSASSCFLLFFVFQKSCTGNILGIGREKVPIPYFSVTKPEPEGDQQGSQEVARHALGAGPGLAAPRVCLGPPGLRRLRPYNLRIEKTLDTRAEIHEKFQRRCH